jgi:hypothetical protein
MKPLKKPRKLRKRRLNLELISKRKWNLNKKMIMRKSTRKSKKKLKKITRR